MSHNVYAENQRKFQDAIQTIEPGEIKSRELLSDYNDIARVLQVSIDNALKVAIKDIKQLINDDYINSVHYNDVKNLIEVKLNNLLRENLNLVEHTPYGNKRC